MHDPLTVIRTIPNPFLPARKAGNHTYRTPLITVWHRDPETDGTDDSCGWFAPKLTKEQEERLRWMAQDEARDPWFQSAGTKKIEDPVAASVLMDGAIYSVALALRVSYSQRQRHALRDRLIHNPVDNCRSMLAYKTGYHGNSDDDAYWREENAMDLFGAIARNILRDLRPWYRHPRWHIHHWQLQVHPIQHLKRWAFTRCCRCGKRFQWGESVVGSWSDKGPQWFKPEPGVHHMDCDGRGVGAKHEYVMPDFAEAARAEG